MSKFESLIAISEMLKDDIDYTNAPILRDMVADCNKIFQTVCNGMEMKLYTDTNTVCIEYLGLFVNAFKTQGNALKLMFMSLDINVDNTMEKTSNFNYDIFKYKNILFKPFRYAKDELVLDLFEATLYMENLNVCFHVPIYCNSDSINTKLNSLESNNIDISKLIKCIGKIIKLLEVEFFKYKSVMFMYYNPTRQFYSINDYSIVTDPDLLSKLKSKLEVSKSM